MQKPSPFGHELRKLRVEHDERQSDLAEAIYVTTEFISSIERGVRNPSYEVVQDIAKHYRLNEEQAERLHDLVVRRVEIGLSGLGLESRMLALDFARRIDRLSPEQVRAVREIICQV